MRRRTVADVAAALGLTDLDPVTWADGVDRAYEEGVHVADAGDGWTLAHGEELGPLLSASEPSFVARLERLSATLGEVQFFGTHRVSDYHAWAWARDGRVVRAFCYVGSEGEFPLVVGDPTAQEVRLGVGDPAGKDPDESTVMAVAGAWSTDPSLIEKGPAGVHGMLPPVDELDPKADLQARARAAIQSLRAGRRP